MSDAITWINGYQFKIGSHGIPFRLGQFGWKNTGVSREKIENSIKLAALSTKLTERLTREIKHDSGDRPRCSDCGKPVFWMAAKVRYAVRCKICLDNRAARQASDRKKLTRANDKASYKRRAQLRAKNG